MKVSRNLVSTLLFLSCLTCLALLIVFPFAQGKDFFMPHLKKSLEPAPDMPELLKNVKTISCMGDSITAMGQDDDSGFPGRLKAYFDALYPQNEITVLNKGVGGHETKHMRIRFKIDTIDANAQLIILFGGVNDVYFGTPKEQFIENLKAMINLALKNNRKIILVTPPLMSEDPDDKKDKVLEEFAEAVRQIAAERELPLADVRKAFRQIATDYRKDCHAEDNILTVDGVHPNSFGYKIITECILDTIGISPDTRQSILKKH